MKETVKAVIAKNKSGLTCEEVCQQLGRKHQSVSPRIHELAKDGEIKALDSVVRKTSSGRPAKVWVIGDVVSTAVAKAWKTALKSKDWRDITLGDIYDSNVDFFLYGNKSRTLFFPGDEGTRRGLTRQQALRLIGEKVKSVQ